ncbi:proteinase-activated receptor 1-like [Sceloporus undulatus]|uniref:proteinase-activated receptor 1-like n=1 Tax=Sceloporus undulatus TaxID=8520 RepID=UPI001C4CC4AB|nr:proteinase-activated receptor 1-like [Sceloporus undulatus]
MAILMFLFKTKLKKPAFIFMFNLASADLLLVTVLPLKISYHLLGHNWAFGPDMCSFATSTFFCNIFCSVLLMTAISIDRFLAVLYPMWSLSWRTPKRASLTCGAIWVVAISGVIPLLMIPQTQKIAPLNITTCLDVLDVSVVTQFRFYAFSLSVLFFFIPLFISTACYVCIIRKLCSPDISTRPSKKRRTVLLCAAVLCSFLLCFGPMNILLLISAIFPYSNNGRIFLAYMLSLCIGNINCCIDPLIYYYASSECQKQVWRFLRLRKHSSSEKDIQRTSSNMTTSSSGLNHLSQT